MNAGYEIKWQWGRFFVGKQDDGKWFLAISGSGSYSALYWSDLNPFNRKETKTCFWVALFGRLK